MPRQCYPLTTKNLSVTDLLSTGMYGESSRGRRYPRKKSQQNLCPDGQGLSANNRAAANHKDSKLKHGVKTWRAGVSVTILSFVRAKEAWYVIKGWSAQILSPNSHGLSNIHSLSYIMMYHHLIALIHTK